MVWCGGRGEILGLKVWCGGRGRGSYGVKSVVWYVGRGRGELLGLKLCGVVVEGRGLLGLRVCGVVEGGELRVCGVVVYLHHLLGRK